MEMKAYILPTNNARSRLLDSIALKEGTNGIKVNYSKSNPIIKISSCSNYDIASILASSNDQVPTKIPRADQGKEPNAKPNETVLEGAAAAAPIRRLRRDPQDPPPPPVLIRATSCRPQPRPRLPLATVVV